MPARLHVGTSGFAYREWKGPFYPENLKARDMLAFYAGRLPSVEINYTFRRDPTMSTLRSWTEATPELFTFSLKAHRRMTHNLRLKSDPESVSGFVETAKLLGDRLGVVLFQCPPTLTYDRPRIEGFLASLPRSFRYAFEFRHPSWELARPLLASYAFAWCVAETDEDPSLSDRPLPDGPFAYLRLRKGRYGQDELKAWADRIGEALGKGQDVFCYFKHEDKGFGPVFAERIAALVPEPPTRRRPLSSDAPTPSWVRRPPSSWSPPPMP